MVDNSMQLFKHKSGMMLRENSCDAGIVSEIQRVYSWMPVNDKKVLDIGGCFGGYTYSAMLNGAKEVWCFEPESENYQTVVKNVVIAKKLSKSKVKVFNEAVIAGHEKTIPFYLSTSKKNRGNYSTLKYRGREEVKVKCRNFDEILNKLKPEVIKMDCEGAEFQLLQKTLPDFIKYITMEIHYTSPSSVKPTWFEQTPYLLKQFDSWNCIKAPKRNIGLWNTIGAWERS